MKRYILLTIVALTACLAMAQPKGRNGQRPRISPEQFVAELHSFITKEANLTDKESKAFFPLFDEMMDKQRKMFEAARKWPRDKTVDDKTAKEIITRRDQIEIDQKKLMQTYHAKFMKVLPARKVLLIIKAEDKFHRRMLRGKK